jgi:Resolvase, N terminal domain
VSRLARNNADWHRLLEICALAGTLICDEDGLYDPAEFNDRLLLGLKGTMSEAELHFIRARLRGGQLSKARRGELQMGLPVGLVYDPAGRVVLDPDAGVQDAIRHLFTVFARTGSARAAVQEFNASGLLFPVRVRTGAHKGELAWMPLRHWRVLRTLHNPATPARSPTAAGGNAPVRTGRRPSTLCPATSGWRSSPMPTPDTSAGNNTRPTRSCCWATPKPTAPTGQQARPAKVRRSCRVWPSAAGADGG